MAGSNYLEALLLISSLVTSQDLSYKLSVSYDDMNVTIQFLNWPTPQRLLILSLSLISIYQTVMKSFRVLW